MKKLKFYVDFSNKNINSDLLTENNYVSVDNLIPNKNGKNISKNIPTKTNCKEYFEGDVLFGNIRPYLKKIWYATNSGGASNDVLVFRCKEKRYSKYVYAILLDDKFYDYCMLASKGTRMPRGDRDHILEYPVVDVENKFIIGKFIYNISKKIEVNNKINDNLEKQIRLLYEQWFVRFDFPDENGKPYKSSGGKMFWNKNIKQEIPLFWSVETIADNKLLSLIKPGIKEFKGYKTYLATADVIQNNIGKGNSVSYNNRESRANMQPIVNSVWFAKMKNSIKHLYLNKEMSPIISTSILSTGFCGLQCIEESFEYIASYIENSYFEIHKNKLAHGATQEAINNDDLEGVHIIVPINTILQAYHKITQPIYAQISSNICENLELIKVRDFLLPILMNGQATISE